jgi:hypothetical protein
MAYDEHKIIQDIFFRQIKMVTLGKTESPRLRLAYK